MNVLEKMLKVINLEKIPFKEQIRVRENENSAPIYISEIRNTRVGVLVVVESGNDKAPMPVNSLTQKAMNAVVSKLQQMFPSKLKTAKII